jgi:hypothetical protein
VPQKRKWHCLPEPISLEYGIAPVRGSSPNGQATVDTSLEQQVFHIRNDSGKRTYISTTSMIDSGEELK